jgi:hypothetical protein
MTGRWLTAVSVLHKGRDKFIHIGYDREALKEAKGFEGNARLKA